MTFLLYCMCEAEAEVTPPKTGVRGAAVQEIASDGLRCFYSEVSDLGGNAAAVQRDALDFHRVTRAAFAKTAVIPFRFPTLVKDTGEMRTFVASHASEYADALKRLRDAVQMEIRISVAGAAAKAATGTEHMRSGSERYRKLKQSWADCNAAAGPYAREWRQRMSRDGVHCWALVDRGEVYNFEQALRGVRLDEAVKVIVSGPWPATEFLEF